MFKKWKLHKKRALTVIEQLKNGEWVFMFNSVSGSYLTAKRNGIELWTSYRNGPFWTDLHPSCNYFGLFWRRIVYRKGILPILKSLEKPTPKENPDSKVFKELEI